MHSALYRGQLRHRRFAPRGHEFSYPLFMMYLDLAELDRVFARRWFWSAKRAALAYLRRDDYFGDAAIPLDEAVRRRVASETGLRPAGPIRMLTHLRLFGFNFNPVTFYYCFDRADSKVETIVAEITNTPWKERYAYVLTQKMNISKSASLRFKFAKSFHVSPFMGMDYEYDWRFSLPGERLSVHMENLAAGDKTFDATLGLERSEITGTTLAKALLTFPTMPLRVVVGIYWQALRLWLKRIPFHSHPALRRTSTDQASADSIS
jgi:DUF1365 family protein